MEKKSSDKLGRWVCVILFSAFSFCWLYFLQHDLIRAEFSSLISGNENISELFLHSRIALPLSLTLVALLLVFPGRLILRFKKGLYACNYIFSAVFLGAVTGYDGDSILGQSNNEWVVTIAFLVILFLVCKIVSSVPKSEYNYRLRALAGNLFIMSLLFCMVAYLGNTDENLHRGLRMERLFDEGEYAELLEVGRYEEESDKNIDLLRAKTMLRLSSEEKSVGTGIGDLLFCYSISDPDALSESLKNMDDIQAYLASCLLDSDLSSFCDSINLDSFKTMPKFFMQALVMADDNNAREKFPHQFAEEESAYKSFGDAMELLDLEPKQIQANSTYNKFHNTYYWYYTFK